MTYGELSCDIFHLQFHKGIFLAHVSLSWMMSYMWMSLVWMIFVPFWTPLICLQGSYTPNFEENCFFITNTSYWHK